jgi:alkylhydroperoxidase/carboxymuconolactone decarboxylase family protein YurZ
MRSRAYREQIAAFRQLFAEFPNQIDEVRDALVRGHLIKLSGLLRMHFKMEEQYIYPELLKQADPAVKALIREFREDLPPVVEEFDDFYTVWSRPGAVNTDPKTFLGEWKHVKIALCARLDREERELFAAFDRAG